MTNVCVYNFNNETNTSADNTIPKPYCTCAYKRVDCSIQVIVL